MRKIGNFFKGIIYRYFSNDGVKTIVSGSGFLLDFFTLGFFMLLYHFLFSVGGVMFWNGFWGLILIYLMAKVLSSLFVGFTPIVNFGRNNSKRFFKGLAKLTIFPFLVFWIFASLFGDSPDKWKG